MPTASGPVRVKNHCRPIFAERQVEARSSLVVIGLRALVEKPQLQVVVQVFTHARQIVDDGNRELPQQMRRPDA